MLTKFNLIVAIAVMACCAEVNAQGCGCDGGYGYAPVAVGGYGGGCGGGTNNCGRDISQGDAAALWGNYCTESCTDNSGGGLFSRLKAKCGGGCGGGTCGGGGFGYGGGGCGCDQGCFGYPSGGCGGGTCGGGGGCLAGKFGGGRHGRGCGLFKGCHGGGASCDASPCGAAPVGFSGGCDTCGCSGEGSYFSQPVGYDYGTAGMHSVVQGCASGACGG